VESVSEARVTVYGFSDYMDVVASDLVHWTPLKTSQSAMDPPWVVVYLFRPVDYASRFI